MEQDLLEAIPEDDVTACINADKVLQKYRSLTCFVSQQHFGYQHRYVPGLYVCSKTCLAVALKKIPNVSRESLQSKDSGIENPDVTGKFPDRLNSWGNVESTGSNGEDDESRCDINRILENAYSKKCQEEMSKIAMLHMKEANNKKARYSDFNSQSSSDTSSPSPPTVDDGNAQNQKSSDEITNGNHQSEEPSVEEKHEIFKIWTAKDLRVSSALANLKSCMVSYVWNPIKFTLQAVDDYECINKMQENIQSYCETAPTLSRIPSVDEVVFAPYQGEFYRGVIEHVNLDDDEPKVLIHYLDFGDAAAVMLSDCKQPCDNIMELHPIYGIVFKCLMQPEFDKDIEESPRLNAALERALRGKLFIKVENKSGLEWEGVLILENLRFWNTILLDNLNNKRAENPRKALGKSSCSKICPPDLTNNPEIPEKVPPPEMSKQDEVENRFQSTEIPAMPKEFIKDLPQRSEVVEGKEVSPVAMNVGYETCRTTMGRMVLSSNLKSGSMVHINFVYSFNQLMISSVDDADSLDILANIISSHVQKAPPMTRIPAPLDIVLALYDGYFYRALVNSYQDTVAKVSFIDYGDKAAVSLSNLREVTAEIVAHPVYGIKLSISQLADNVASIKSKRLDDLLLNIAQAEMTDIHKVRCEGDLWIKGRRWSELVEQEYLAGDY